MSNRTFNLFYLTVAAVGVGNIAALSLAILGRTPNWYALSLLVLTLLIMGMGVYLVWQTHAHDATRRRVDHQDYIFTYLAEAVIETDQRMRIRRWNPAAERMYGWSAGEVMGKPMRQFIETIYVNEQTHLSAFERVNREGHWFGEVLQPRRDGTYITVQSSVSTLRDSAGRISGYIGINQDITEQRRAKDTLRNREAQLNAVISNAPLIILALDRNLRVTFAQGISLFALAGRPPEHVVGLSIDDVMPADAQTPDRCRQVLSGKVMESVVDTNAHIFDLRFSPLYSDERTIDGVVIIAIDITERTRTDETLQRYALRLEVLRQIDAAIISQNDARGIARVTLELLTLLCEYQIASVFTFDEDYTYATPLGLWDVGQAVVGVRYRHLPAEFAHLDALRSANYRPVSILDMRNQTVINPVDQLYLDMKATGIYIAPLLYRDVLIGQITLAGSADQILDPNTREVIAQITSLLAVAIEQANLTDQVKRYAAILEENVQQEVNRAYIATERADLLFNTTTDAIALVGIDGSVRQVNLSFESMFNCERHMISGNTLLQLMPAHEYQPIAKSLKICADTNQPQRLEVDIHPRDADPFSVDASISPIFDIHGAVSVLLLSLRDITESKATQTKLRDALQHERDLNQLKSRFVSIVSHEFRTPLTVIGSSAGLLELGGTQTPADRFDKHISQILSAVGLMTSLLDDVVVLGKGERGEIEFNAQAVDLNAVVKQVVEDVQLASDDSHEFTMALVGDGEPLMITADPKLLRQIITNLTTNAVKYTPPDQPITLRTMLEDDEQVALHVIDRGRGIPENEQEHLFRAFFRASNVGTVQGTGLGLSIVKQAVGLHHGTIAFDSQVGRGTHFTVRLPRHLLLVEETSERKAVQ